MNYKHEVYKQWQERLLFYTDVMGLEIRGSFVNRMYVDRCDRHTDLNLMWFVYQQREQFLTVSSIHNSNKVVNEILIKRHDSEPGYKK